MSFKYKLQKETEIWVKKEIVSEEQKEQILGLYEAEGAKNPAYLLFAVVGSVLIGTGIILIFAVNWRYLPRGIKLLIAFMPLVLAQAVCLFAFFRKPDSASFKEGSAIFLCASIFATAALITQVFHIQGDLDTYLLTCILLTLPGIYLINAAAPAAVYTAGAIWAGLFYSQPLWLSFITIGLIIPFLTYRLSRSGSKGEISYMLLLISAVVVFAISKLLGDSFDFAEALLNCGVALLLLDEAVWKWKTGRFLTLARFLGCFIITFIVLAASFSEVGFDYYMSWGVPLIVLMTLIYLVINFTGGSYANKFKNLDVFFIAAVIIYATGFSWLVANIISAALGVYYVITGGRRGSLKRMNFGMFMLIIIIAARFFDSGLGLLERGVAFVLIGVFFLAVNVVMYRRKKGAGNEE